MCFITFDIEDVDTGIPISALYIALCLGLEILSLEAESKPSQVMHCNLFVTHGTLVSGDLMFLKIFAWIRWRVRWSKTSRCRLYSFRSKF